MSGNLNHVAWARSMIGFIRERGLEGEFKDWCGGWPCRVASPDDMSKNPENLNASGERVKIVDTPPTAEPGIGELLAAAYEVVKEWPEKRGDPMTVGGAGFMDLLALRNLVPEVLALIESQSAEIARLKESSQYSVFQSQRDSLLRHSMALTAANARIERLEGGGA